MTVHIGAYQAKTHLSRLLEQVEQGERIIITKHGAPVAVLAPYAAASRISVSETISALHSFRRQHRLDGLSLRDMIEEGRR